MTRVNTSVTVNPGAWAQLQANAGAQWGNRVGRAVVNAMQERCPVDEGRLRASLTHTVRVEPGRVVLTVGSPLDYAVYVARGTGVYGPKKARIYPKTAQALKFPTPRLKGPLKQGQKPATGRNRGMVFAKSVAGQPPNTFMVDGFQAVCGRVTVNAV